MSGRRSSGTRIEGDVNVTNGDVVAGDKTVSGKIEGAIPAAKPTSRTQHKKSQARGVKGSLEVEGGDVVFGDKIINFIQKKLNVYLFKDIWQLALFLAVVLLVAGGIVGAVWYSRQPRKMSGNFNIVVAQFGEIKADGSIGASANAERISSTLFNFLDSEYRASGLGLVVQVAHRNMPLIIEEEQAAGLAKRVNANIIIFGNISGQGDQAEFSPRFYVAEKADTTELTGQSQLAYPIQFNLADLGTDSEIHAMLRLRTEILFNFTKGMIYYSKGDLEAAARSLATAIDSAEALSKPFAGEEALYLMAAKIKIAQKDNAGANLMLDKALDLNHTYARAFLARGNILYSQAVGSNFDAALLDQALQEYVQAYEAQDQPEQAYIPIKAHTAMGNVLVVRAQQTNDADLFTQAIQNYSYVTDTYERTNDPYVRGFAAVAYFGLGAAHEREGEKVEAVKCYQRAYDLTNDNSFKDRIKNQIKAVQGN